MTATLLGALATAGLLGVTHAIEPDHVAGISSLTSEYGDSRLSALVGACFSLGHVALVVAWLAVGYLLLGMTDYPSIFDTVGTLGVAVLLGLLGALMVTGGLRRVLHTHEHDHGDGTSHAHPHLHLPVVGSGGGHGRDGHDHDHTIGAYLTTGVVGALFTLSPPLSMIAFASTLFPTYGGGAIALSVVVYAVGITLTMSAIGAGVGTVFGMTQMSDRTYGAARAVAGVAVIGFAASTLAGVVPVFG
ncbi:MAG: hypothetical protein ABEH35_00480 [Haloarculaceae archaeon]